DVYDAATELAYLSPRVNDPGPSNNDYLTACGDWGHETDIDRLVAAARVGYQHGFHEGHGDGTWSAGSRLPSEVHHRGGLDPAAPGPRARGPPGVGLAPPPSVRIDGPPPNDGLRAVDPDPRWAADAARHSRQPAQLPPASAAGRAFAPLTAVLPVHTPSPA